MVTYLQINLQIQLISLYTQKLFKQTACIFDHQASQPIVFVFS